MQWRILTQRAMDMENATVLPLLLKPSVPSLDSLDATTLFSLSTTAFWILQWMLRDRRDPTRSQDAFIFIIFLLWRSFELFQIIASTLLSHFQHYVNFTSSLALFATCGAGLALVHIILTSENEAFTNATSDRPWILPSRTTHTRVFPKKHSFAYSYLQVAIPVGFVGRCGSLMSVEGTGKKGWLHVQGSDYLDRSSSRTSLKGRLSEYLQSQNVGLEEWHHAYLITAPRFLGYVFNPVSFWYIYTEDNHLSMMILEVNNTFDERRIYLLKATGSNGELDGSTDEPSGDTLGKFKKTWGKDFHVSPFNSRKGHYSLTAINPFSRPGTHPIFDNSIILKSSKDHVKLVARVFSEGDPIDPSTASFWSTARFLLGWFWVGFVTFPRILKEAFALFSLRKLHVWLRPEVTPTSLGRIATSIELSLEPFFISYLQYLVEKSDVALDVVYKSPTSKDKSCRFSSIKSHGTDGALKTLEIRILSPIFFSRLIHYAYTSEAFDRECTFTDEKNRTIWISRPDLLPLLLKSERDVVAMSPRLNTMDRLRWNAHRRFRCPPASPTYPAAQKVEQAEKVEDIRMLPYSPMDRFVQTQSDCVWLYRRQCMRLFLAQRLALGFTPVVDGLDLTLRVCFIHLAVSRAFQSSDASIVADLSTSALQSSLVHVLAFIKGTV